MKLLKVLFSLFFTLVVSATLSFASGIPLAITGGTLFVSSLFKTPTGALSAKLTKEIWLAEIMEQFIPDTSFLSAARDLSSLVEYNVINLAEAGVEPDVLIDNTTYPVPFADRADTPYAIPLKTFDTEGTVIRNAEKYELAYDKLKSVVSQHKNALIKKYAQLAAYNYAPAEDTEFTPVIKTSGGENLSGNNKLTFDDVLALKTKFDLLDAPNDRILVLNPIHFNELAAADLTYMKQIFNGGLLFGFKLFIFNKTALYDATTFKKKAASATTGLLSSLAFIGSEVMRAQGTYDMFERLNDPEQKGDIINFQMRGHALPMRNKYLGSIISIDHP